MDDGMLCRIDGVTSTASNTVKRNEEELSSDINWPCTLQVY